MGDLESARIEAEVRLKSTLRRWARCACEDQILDGSYDTCQCRTASRSCYCNRRDFLVCIKRYSRIMNDTCALCDRVFRTIDPREFDHTTPWSVSGCSCLQNISVLCVRYGYGWGLYIFRITYLILKLQMSRDEESYGETITYLEAPFSEGE